MRQVPAPIAEPKRQTPLKILISSHAFAPHIGGIETVSRLLAEEFFRLGESVKVVTQTPAGDGEEFPFPVTRQPSMRQLLALIRWCDVFWHNNLSIRTAWPLLFVRRPFVITHAGSYSAKPVGLDIANRLKHAVVNRVTSVAISTRIAECFKTNSVIIPNPYDIGLFSNRVPGVERAGDLVFLGRLVTEKGIDILLHALGLLRTKDLRPRLTIVGSGSELQPMQELASSLGIQEQVRFVGPKRGAELAEILNQHKILVVPSRYDEPFGVVALEGIACGCVVVGSSGGGLPEAIGPCGLTFPNGDVEALAKVLEKMLCEPAERQRLLANAPAHLVRFHPTTIANAYLGLFRSKLR